MGTCQTVDHVAAGRAHLVVGLLGMLAIASAVGFILGEAVIVRWHLASRAYHERQRA